MIPLFWDRRGFVQGSLAEVSDRRARALAESVERAGGRIVHMLHDEIHIEAPREKLDQVRTMLEAFFKAIPQSVIDAIARGPAPLERLVRPVRGERCPRCHAGADDTKICGLCGALCPTCGSAVGPYWCPGCGAT